MYFEYGAQETEYLARKDKRLGAAIEQIGHIDRAVDGDLFSSVVHQIVGQQISTKAQETIWQRMQQTLGTVDAGHILAAGVPELQKLGITYRKAEYITDFARKVQTGECRIEEIWQMPDEEVIRVLSSLKGIGVWTAEMILLFCMQRPDVLSYDDLAIQRGLRMLYHHRKIDRRLFEKYGAATDPMAVWPACTCGPLRVVRFRVCGTTHPLSRAVKNRKPSELHGGAAMLYTGYYHSPLGRLLLAADEIGLTGLWFERQRYFAQGLAPVHTDEETPILAQTRRWLDLYFSGSVPDFTPPLHPIGSDFRQEVWALLLQIPYGKTTTYGALANQLAEKHGQRRMSAQAVGGAVGHNAISIIIPCHRVVGADGSLTGYAGGLDTKARLLAGEGVPIADNPPRLRPDM